MPRFNAVAQGPVLAGPRQELRPPRKRTRPSHREQTILSLHGTPSSTRTRILQTGWQRPRCLLQPLPKAIGTSPPRSCGSLGMLPMRASEGASRLRKCDSSDRFPPWKPNFPPSSPTSTAAEVGDSSRTGDPGLLLALPLGIPFVGRVPPPGDVRNPPREGKRPTNLKPET